MWTDTGTQMIKYAFKMEYPSVPGFKWWMFEFLTAYAQESSRYLSNPVYCKRHLVSVMDFYEKMFAKLLIWQLKLETGHLLL